MTYDHTENKRLYCEDWQETDKPWLRWQFRDPISEGPWADFGGHPTFSPFVEYRRKPVTRTVTIELPVVSEERTDFELRAPLVFMGRCFYFKTREDRDAAYTAICGALEQAKEGESGE